MMMINKETPVTRIILYPSLCMLILFFISVTKIQNLSETQDDVCGDDG
jgi:hypothetical protein